jgi:anti-sigma-K factor RskA
MNEPLDLEYIKNLAAGFVVDDLTPEEAEKFRGLLIQYPELNHEIADLQDVLWQVLDGFTVVEPPPDLWPAILENAEGSGAQSTGIQHSHSNVPGNFPLRWKSVVGSIAALLVVILGVDYYRLRQDLGVVVADNQRLRQEFAQAQVVNTLLQEPKTRLFTFRSVNTVNNASGSIVMNPEQQKALILVQNLSPPPSGRVYVLWAVVANEKLPCGEIKPYSWGNASYEVPFTPEMYRDFYHPNFSGLVVTLEADPKVSRPTGPTVMQSSQI